MLAEVMFRKWLIRLDSAIRNISVHALKKNITSPLPIILKQTHRNASPPGNKRPLCEASTPRHAYYIALAIDSDGCCNSSLCEALASARLLYPGRCARRPRLVTLIISLVAINSDGVPQHFVVRGFSLSTPIISL